MASVAGPRRLAALAARTALPVVLSIALGAMPVVARTAERPLSGPCAPGITYDPACDVDHDGDVDISDIQLTASHWNQTGAWLSDNAHDHLGQTWTGNTSLRLTGSYGPPYYAPLVLDNSYSTGDGLRVESVSTNGVTIDQVGWDGVSVVTAGRYGYWVYSAGNAGLAVTWAGVDGINVGSAGANGLTVGSAGVDGINVGSADGNGLYVGSADANGVYVGSAGAHGVYALTTNSSYNGVYGINAAGGNGIRGDSNGAITSGVYGENTGGGFGVAGRVINGGRAVYGEAATGWAGWFNGSVTITGSCTGCLLASFAINTGARALEPGDIVSIRALRPAEIDNALMLWDVLPTQPGQAAVGVVAGGAELVVGQAQPPAVTDQYLVPRAGAAGPGEYVTIIYGGPMQVRLQPGEPDIAAGTRLTAAGDGRVRPLQSRRVDGMEVAEGAPVLGLALNRSEDGLVLVLVNPQ